MTTTTAPLTALAVLLPGSKNLIVGTWIIGDGTLVRAGRRGAVHWKPQRSGGAAVWFLGLAALEGAAV